MTNPYIPKPSLDQLYPIPSDWDSSKLNLNSLVYPTPADDFQEYDEDRNSLKLKEFCEEDLFFFIMNHKNVHPICIGIRIEGEKEEDNTIVFFNWDDYPYMKKRWNMDYCQQEFYKEFYYFVKALALYDRLNKTVRTEEEKLLNKFN